METSSFDQMVIQPFIEEVMNGVDSSKPLVIHWKSKQESVSQKGSLNYLLVPVEGQGYKSLNYIPMAPKSKIQHSKFDE